MTKTAISVLPYNEDILESSLGDLIVQVRRPSRSQVVMGAGGKAEREVHGERLSALAIPLFKRKGGGGTVLLGPNTLVVTVHAGVVHPFQNLAYFAAINQALIGVFRLWAPCPFVHQGISDIAVGGRKIVGTSIFRRRQYLLYQASILVDLDIELMEKVLRHPPREPDYRRGRGHRDFVTCLRDLGIKLTHTRLMKDLEIHLPAKVRHQLDQVDRQPGNAHPQPK